MISPALKFIFSWVILMPTAVVMSGKFLSQAFKLSGDASQHFVIPIPPFFRVEARNHEVTLGLGAFILTLLAVGLVAGRFAYQVFRTQFGIDPGHFNSLCILSSFLTVAWAILLYVLLVVLRSGGVGDEAVKEHAELIDDLSGKGEG